MEHLQGVGRSIYRHIRHPWHIVVGSLLAISMAFFAYVFPVSAAQTVPYKMNFQGRLTDASGVPKADGLYNMKFRIFDAASGGTELWSETRETTNRVQVTDGLFSVQLGDVTPLDPADFNSASSRYFEIELPTPATATCSTASCGTFSEGAMTPRNPLGTSAYSLNADRIDGIDGASIATLGGTNSFSAFNTFTSYVNVSGAGELSINSTNSTTKLNVIDNDSNVLLRADTTNLIVKVGTTDAATLSNVRLISTSAEFTGTVRIGTATNGVDISGANGIVLSGTARPTKVIELNPEFAGATFTGDGTNNIGSLSSDFCSGSSLLNINASKCGANDEHNYYAWTTTEATAQDYDIFIRYKIPSDYSAGSLSFVSLMGRGTSASESAVMSLYSGSATPCVTLSDPITSADTWSPSWSTSPIGACTINAGTVITIRVTLSATTNNTVYLGPIEIEYKSRY